VNRGLVVAGILFLSGCLAPRQPADPRYFSPQAPPAASSAATRAAATGAELRLRRVFAADYLRTRMVWRRGVEVGFYDLQRWTELPARYVQARLEDELFEVRGLRRVSRASARSITVELLAFDDVLEPEHRGVVSLQVLLMDQAQVALLDRNFSASRPIDGDDPEATARALGEALNEAIEAIGAAVVDALGPGLP
jgi:ABC-type uncharacterized transport system auxiliary subunit